MTLYGSGLYGAGLFGGGGGGGGGGSGVPGIQILVAFNNEADDDPGLISLVATPPGTLGATNVWTDITGYCTGYTMSRGRQHELSQFESGSCQVTVDGRAAGAIFDPWNTTSPYAGLMQIRKPFQVRAINSATHYRFTGQVDSWATQWPDASSTAEVIHSSDLFRMLNTADTPDYPGTVILDSAAIYLRLNDPVGTVTPHDSSGNNVNASVVAPITFGNPGALGPIDLGTSATIGVGGDGAINIPEVMVSPAALTLECWFKAAAGSLYANLFFNDGNGFACGFQILAGLGITMYASGVGAAGPVVNDGNWHHLVGTASPAGSVVAMYVDGVLVASTSATVAAFSGGPFNASSTLVAMSVQELAAYPAALTAAQVATHYAAASYPQESSGARINRMLTIAEWPTGAGSRSVDTNGTLVQANTQDLNQTAMLSHMQSVEATEAGALFMAGAGEATFLSRQTLFSNSLYTTSQQTLGDNTAGGDIPFLPGPTLSRDDIDLYNEAIAARNGGVQADVINTASINTYGRSTWRPSAALIGVSDAETVAMAQYVVGKYSTPIDRFAAVTVDMAALAISFPALVDALLSLDLLQRVTVERTHIPGGGTAFTQISQIEHLTETVAPNSWTITFGLTVADPLPFWILGTSALGSNTRLAF